MYVGLGMFVCPYPVLTVSKLMNLFWKMLHHTCMCSQYIDKIWFCKMLKNPNFVLSNHQRKSRLVFTNKRLVVPKSTIKFCQNKRCGHLQFILHSILKKCILRIKNMYTNQLLLILFSSSVQTMEPILKK